MSVESASVPLLATSVATPLEAEPLPLVAGSASPLDAVAGVAGSPTASAAASTNPQLVIGAGTRVLCLGDSFTDAGFSQRLQQLVEQRGGRFFHDSWTSSTTKSWATKDRLPQLLAATKPDVVIIVLGANEVLLSSPEKMAPFVTTIAARIAPRPCAWVSPPLWKGETGIVGVTRAASAPCSFFDSGALALDKRPDGIHPTAKGGGQWADAFWAATVVTQTPSAPLVVEAPTLSAPPGVQAPTRTPPPGVQTPTRTPEQPPAVAPGASALAATQ